jgi:hypothetical protein
MDWSEEVEDKFGYEEYKRATERRRNNVRPKKLTDKEESAPDSSEQNDSKDDNKADK